MVAIYMLVLLQSVMPCMRYMHICLSINIICIASTEDVLTIIVTAIELESKFYDVSAYASKTCI